MAKVLFVVAAAMIMLMNGISAEKYTVGDEKGWIIRPSLDYYSSWAAKHKFEVGDVLVFNFRPEAHTVAMVSKEGYDKCDAGDVEIYKEPTEITLNRIGAFYFICTVAHHCEYHGQKLAIGIGITVPSMSSKVIPLTSTFFCLTFMAFVLAFLYY